VHLTIGGYLTAAGQALAVSGSAVIMLAGWDPGKTYWLADAVHVGWHPDRWVERDSELLGWAAAK
jgi:hypothetical protein